MEESYFVENFADFYDEMVSLALPKEYEAAQDIEVYFLEILQQLRDPELKIIRVLDLCTGTGRVILGLLDKIKALGNEVLRFEIIGVDYASGMVQKAQDKVNSWLDSNASVRASTTVRYVVGSIALRETFEQISEEFFNLVIISAGSFHHLLNLTDHLTCLECIRERLLPQGHLIMLLFRPEKILAQSFDPNVPLKLGDFERTQVSRRRTQVKADSENFEVMSDHDVILEDTFRFVASGQITYERWFVRLFSKGYLYSIFKESKMLCLVESEGIKRTSMKLRELFVFEIADETIEGSFEPISLMFVLGKDSS